MIAEFPIDPKWIPFAEKMSEEMGSLRGSITKGKGNLAGHLGEFVVFDIVGGEYEPTFDYDILWKGKRLDVKTKNCTSPPEPHYNCTVAAFNTKQKCDFYVFTRVLENLKTCWVLGYLSKDEFYRKSKFFNKGDIDPESSFHWPFKDDCYNVRIDELNSFEELICE